MEHIAFCPDSKNSASVITEQVGGKWTTQKKGKADLSHGNYLERLRFCCLLFFKNKTGLASFVLLEGLLSYVDIFRLDTVNFTVLKFLAATLLKLQAKILSFIASLAPQTIGISDTYFQFCYK